MLLGKRELISRKRMDEVVEENRRELAANQQLLPGGINGENSLVSSRQSLLSRSGGRPTTSSSCMSPETGSIVPKINDPRYPNMMAPVASKDFLRVSESAKNLPWCDLSQREANEQEKQRLINKSFQNHNDGVYETQVRGYDIFNDVFGDLDTHTHARTHTSSNDC